jgi:SacI homology domain
VQIRGSIPLFWSSPVNLQYHPPVRLGEDDSLNSAALQQHALQLAQHYGSSPRSLVFVNLVDKSKDQVSKEFVWHVTLVVEVHCAEPL